jgi:hypothetical protein
MTVCRTAISPNRISSTYHASTWIANFQYFTHPSKIAKGWGNLKLSNFSQR